MCPNLPTVAFSMNLSSTPEPPRASFRMAAPYTLAEVLAPPPRMPSARPSSSGFFSPADGRFQDMGPDTPKWPLRLSGPSPLCASQLPSCSLESRNPVTEAPCRVSQHGSPWAASQAASGHLELKKPALYSGASAKPPCPRGLSYPWTGGGRVFLSLHGPGALLDPPKGMRVPWFCFPLACLIWRDSRKASQLRRVAGRPNYFTLAHALVVT